MICVVIVVIEITKLQKGLDAKKILVEIYGNLFLSFDINKETDMFLCLERNSGNDYTGDRFRACAWHTGRTVHYC